MGRKTRRGDAWPDDDHDLPRSARARPRGGGRGDRPGREQRKKAKEQPAPQHAGGRQRVEPVAARELDVGFLLPFDDAPAPAPTKVCGRCRNWLERAEIGGRGECDHPGSGIMFPYNDTPACPFWERR